MRNGRLFETVATPPPPTRTSENEADLDTEGLGIGEQYELDDDLDILQDLGEETIDEEDGEDRLSLEGLKEPPDEEDLDTDGFTGREEAWEGGAREFTPNR